MKKKAFVFLVIVVGLLLAGCGKAETNSMQQSVEDTSLIGKWEIDYDYYEGKADNVIYNMEFTDGETVILDMDTPAAESINKYRMRYDLNDGKLSMSSNEMTNELNIEVVGDKMYTKKADKDFLVFRKVKNEFKYPYTKSEDASQSLKDTTIPSSEKSEYVFTAGNYEVGTEIPAGKYDVEWVSGRGNCFAGDMSETFGEGEYRIKEYKNLTLTKTDTIKVSGTLEIKFISK